MTLAEAVFQIFCSQDPLWIKCLSLKRRIIQSNFDRILWKGNCMPDIMILAQAVLQTFCSQGCFSTQNNSLKREVIQSNIYRILPKANQVIYTLDTIYVPNIMTPAQAVLQIFSSQGPLWVKCLSPKNGIIHSSFDRILWKVNLVIYTMYPNCMPDILFTRLLYNTKCQSQKREII